MVLSIASRAMPSGSLVWRYLMTLPLPRMMEILHTLPERRFPTSVRMCGIPVTNVQVAGGFWEMWFNEPRTLTRYLARHFVWRIHAYESRLFLGRGSLYTSFTTSAGWLRKLPWYDYYTKYGGKNLNLEAGNFVTPPFLDCFKISSQIVTRLGLGFGR